MDQATVDIALREAVILDHALWRVGRHLQHFLNAIRGLRSELDYDTDSSQGENVDGKSPPIQSEDPSQSSLFSFAGMEDQ